MQSELVDRYLRWAQVGIGVALILVASLFLTSGAGTMATSNVTTSVESFSHTFVAVGVTYSTLNPGPVAFEPVNVSIMIITPDGAPLSNQSYRLITVGPFQSSSGRINFNMTLVPGASATIANLQKQGLSPVIVVRMSTSFWGVTQASATFSSAAVLG